MTPARCAAFAGVGAIGFGVQIAALWLLTGRLGMPYLLATIVATEAAIVLNFFCHQAWTWRDRRAAGGMDVARRLLRFHLTNGLVSLGGSAMLVPLFVERGRLDYLAANALAVAVCALANLLAADRLVFVRALAMVLAVFAVAPGAEAAPLRPDTIAAFDRYVRLTEARMNRDIRGTAPFLWVDRLSAPEREDAYRRLAQGEVVIGRPVTRDAGRVIDAPHGLIHHWIGTIFIPGATLARTVALMQAYDRYPDLYAPNVRRARVTGHEDDHFTVDLQLFMKKIIGVVLDTEYDVQYTRIGAGRENVRSYSTRIAEEGGDNGFLWRFDSYCSIDERAGRTGPGTPGTYVQCESISLSRAIPAGLGWLVGSFVTSIPRESLEFTLGKMRAALLGRG